MSNNSDKQLDFDDAHLANILFGPQGMNLRNLERKAGVRIQTRGAQLSILGGKPEVELVANLLCQFYALVEKGVDLHPRDFEHAYTMLTKTPSVELHGFFYGSSAISFPRRNVTPKTLTQRDYVQSLRDCDIVFGVGPAGTGKTYLAVAMAVSMLLSRRVKRIVLTRPAVEAGERLGFLPGDLAEKVNPYLRPLYDALYDLLDFEKVSAMFDSGVIEIAPLAFMRGRTLNDSFVILDEAQNATPEQMKMFLTRMGFGSHVAVTGDITQIDLPANGGAERSGLIHALKVLSEIEGVKIVRFGKDDVVRHPLVGKIVEAYAKQNLSAG